MKMKNIFLTVLISALTTIAILFAYSKLDTRSGNPNFSEMKIPVNYAGFFNAKGEPEAPSDFSEAAKAAIPTVVHIKTKSTPKKVTNNLPNKRNPFSDLFPDDMWDQFFGDGSRRRAIPQLASGSGVIISNDGYIITNNHVVDGADEVTVTTSNQKTYTAKVIGADGNYDLAVVKIDAKDLPFMLYGTSRDVEIGQWVLAIGYPLTLDATVTAGIISAKSRSLGLNRSEDGNASYAVESYLQTDAAVNRGNSGGPLINLKGQLIGINSAIASPTGFYSGYSYAIPVDIVRKVVNDLIKFGTVQRGFLGVSFPKDNITAEQMQEQGVPDDMEGGVYITSVIKDGAAAKANLQKGDIIKKVNGVKTNSAAELQQEVSLYSPGDEVQITYERNKKEYTVKAKLQNKVGDYEMVKAPTNMDILGADLEALTPAKSKQYGITGGIVVKRIRDDGVLNEQTRMRDGFIITEVDGEAVKSIEDFGKAVGNKKQVTVSGVYPGYSEIYEYPLDLSE